MLSELYLYSLHFFKAKSRNRFFGHLKEIIALRSRAKRLKLEWSSHHQHCHQTIQEFIKPNSKVLILGAGPLNEIPIEILSTLCQRIDLVDTFFLNETKNKVLRLKHNSKIYFFEHDITEMEDKMAINTYAKIETPKKFLDEHYDFVLSINIWSQLIRHFKILEGHPDEHTLKIQLLNSHLDYLLSFTHTKILFISDIETMILNKNHQIIETDPFLSDILNNHTFSKREHLIKTQWLWNLAPFGEWSQNEAIQMKVMALGLQR